MYYREFPEQNLITPEELNDPAEALFSGGIMKFHRVREAIDARVADERARLIREDCADAEEAREITEMRQLAADLVEDSRRKKALQAREGAPLWQKLTGLFPLEEAEMNPNERAESIVWLLREVERVVRVELRERRGRERGGEMGGQGDGKTIGCEEEASVVERLVNAPPAQWDPLRGVCLHLCISQRRLSSYAREILGVSAPEIVDQIRMESVRGQLKSALKNFVAAFYAQRKRGEKTATEGTEDAEDGVAEQIWDALKRARRAPYFHRTSWANDLGFSSYSRFFRACVLKYGLTPHELEMEILEEIVDACELPGNSSNGGHEDHEEKRKEQEEEREGNDSNDEGVVKRE